jgi:RNA polymerase sigma-70 factor, ECF subfamily
LRDRTAEAVLATTLVQGDEAAFASIYETFSTRVFNLVLRSVRDRQIAEDVCQEIWLKVHREASKLRAPDAFAVWLYRLAARVCIDSARSRHREMNSELPEDLIDEATSEQEAAAVQRSQARLAWQALAALPPRQSMALYLKQLEGCDYKQIARILDCSVSKVESLLFRARQGLARVYHAMELSQHERCTSTRQVMAAVLDGEANGVQKRGMELHLEECTHCRTEMSGMRKAVAGYAALPLLSLSRDLLPAVLSTGASASTGASFAQLLGLIALKTKTALTVFAIATAVAGATGAAAAATGLELGPANALGDVVESVMGSSPDVPSAVSHLAGEKASGTPGSAPRDAGIPSSGARISSNLMTGTPALPTTSGSKVGDQNAPAPTSGSGLNGPMDQTAAELQNRSEPTNDSGSVLAQDAALLQLPPIPQLVDGVVEALPNVANLANAVTPLLTDIVAAAPVSALPSLPALESLPTVTVPQAIPTALPALPVPTITAPAVLPMIPPVASTVSIPTPPLPPLPPPPAAALGTPVVRPAAPQPAIATPPLPPMPPLPTIAAIPTPPLPPMPPPPPTPALPRLPALP